MLEHNTRRIGNVAILDLAGRIRLGGLYGLGSEVKIGDLVRQLMREGQTSILLNLRDVPYIDSSGIANLFGAFTSAERQGGVLKILSPTKVVRNELDATHLSRFIPIMDDEQEAIRSFRRVPQAMPEWYTSP